MKSHARMLLSLDGLSVGDAFGELFFASEESLRIMLTRRILPDPPWNYTDDTEMAISIVESLGLLGRIVPDDLAACFVRRYTPWRGYGPGAHRLLTSLSQGADWREETPAMFGGMGSFGNGAAMRVAPLGAYFAHDLDAVVLNARLSAEPTHSHPEAVAGAIAVAVAAALSWRTREEGRVSGKEFLEQVAEGVPESATKEGILRAAEIPFDEIATLEEQAPSLDVRPAEVAAILGSGWEISSQDTVPFALWCAARHLYDYRAALWATASGLGDVDTTCAIVGGIVSLSACDNGIPQDWLCAREPLPMIGPSSTNESP